MVTDEKATKPVTTAPDCVSTSVTVKPLDDFKETFENISCFMFVLPKIRYF